MRIGTLALVSLALGASVAAGQTATAGPRTETATNGNTTASLSYDLCQGAGCSGLAPASNLRLTIAKNGAVDYDQPVEAAGCMTDCQPFSVGFGAPSSLHVLDLNGSGEPQVLLDLWSGGAHCCKVTQIFRFQALSSTYVEVEHNFGDPGYMLKDLRNDGHPLFVTADDRFANQFGCYACSGLPLEILEYTQANTLIPVTKQFPALIHTDAREQWFRFVHRGPASLGFIAAWAADEDLLGREHTVARTLARQLRRGRLNYHDIAYPGRERFIAHLQRFLHRLQYRP